jgi:aspartate carbamoyltransferase catalytic subunit
MTSSFPHRHLLDIARLSPQDITTILNLADHYADENRAHRRSPAKLAGKAVVNLFFEASTRTRLSFEFAAKRLGADVINVAIEHSSVSKGESLLDMIQSINAMKVDAMVIRHKENGVPQFLAPHVSGSVINAGDGWHEHPTQALLDALTMRRRKGKLEGLIVAICGDIQHSRVARSNIQLLQKMGAKVRIVAPAMFMPQDLDKLKAEAYDTMDQGLKDADVVMMLRIQHERLAEGEFALSLKDYHHRYGLNHDKLKAAKPDVIVMHPGPINREVEITSTLADDKKYSVILEQIEMGCAVKMAVLDLTVG